MVFCHVSLWEAFVENIRGEGSESEEWMINGGQMEGIKSSLVMADFDWPDEDE